jgi:membrane-associated protein
MRLGEYLFSSHGGKIVLLGRFLTVLRAYGGLLAGSYRMPAGRYQLFNALGAMVWATTTGLTAYFFGEIFHHAHRAMGFAMLGVGGAVVVGGLLYLRVKEGDLQRKADQALISG